MKVTRLKRGYRISLSDAEFEALCTLIDYGRCDLEGEQPDVGGRVGWLLTSGRFAEYAAMRIDEDRR